MKPKFFTFFSVLVVGATLLQAQTITVHQTCGLNGQVVKAIPPEAAQAVDLGLSVKWANMNVGAESPEGYGNYYAWGETAPKTTYNFSTYFDTNDGGSTFTKYNNDGGKTVLDQQDDAAHVNWGGSWRMPTKTEWQELYDNCTWTWTTQNGIKGYKVTSNKEGYADKFIFLPAAGFRRESDLYYVGSFGRFWSSSLLEGYSNHAGNLRFDSDYHGLNDNNRYYGLSVRPVLPFSALANNNDTIRIYSNGCDDYQTFIGSHGSQLTMTANSDQWSHFVRWQDDDTDNPRTIVTNGNANYTAYFETPKFSVRVQSDDAARGSGYISKVVKAGTIDYNESVGSFDAGSEVYLAFQANYGYHFAQWSDGNTSQQRSFILAKDTTFTATFAKNIYNITKQCNSSQGSIIGLSQAEYLDNVTLEATPKYGYHFVRWNDDNTDNPRSFAITKDTTFTAEFAKNTYSIATASSNPAWGSAAGDGSALYLDEMQISATANYGYHFAYWNDGDYSNPRTITVRENKTYYAVFEKNLYSITKQCNSEQGYIDGNSQAEYLDEVTITAIPNYGYHFVQWSDGLKTNLRSFVITKDTTFTAEFAVDRTGTCGNDWALTWRYDPTAKALTISGNGIFAQNIQCGVEARTALQQVIFEKGVTEVGASAFANCSNLKTLIISEDVKKIGEQAFYNCENLTAIYNYRPTPTMVYSNTFDGVEKFECTLHVLASSVDMYKAATGWSEFFYVEPIGAEEATTSTDEVTVETTDNTATMTWPTDDNAASYTIQITKDGVVFCTLIFNGNGQLIGIAFAPSRDRQSQPLAAKQVANGLQFTVTGLNSATHYAFSLTAKDSQETVLASYTGEFTTTGEAQVPTGIDEIDSSSLQGGDRGRLILRDGQLLILRGDKVYTITGAEVK